VFVAEVIFDDHYNIPDLRRFYALDSMSANSCFAMTSGIPQDEAAAISIALEGILYGECRDWDSHP
jgi:hypothetical protein